MTMLRPAWMQAASGDSSPVEYTAQADRLVLQAMFSREGVLDLLGGGLKVVQRAEGANMTVDIQAGGAAIRGDDTSDQGTYQCTATTKENRSIPAAPGSGTRRHRVVARVRDKLANAGLSDLDWVIEVLPDPGTGTPVQPDSAITLAYVNVAAAQVSVQTANIEDARSQASVGTPAMVGAWGAINSAWQASDATRPLRWEVNADGWVMLSGWVRWTGGNSPVPAGEQRTFAGTPFADPLVKPKGIRDFCGATIFGPMHYAVFPSGALYFRPQGAITNVFGSWYSFDGCFYRL